MILNCTICGKTFTHTSTGGRPPGACSTACRTRARTDPYHCSKECHAAKDLTCLQCGKQAPPESRFCSAECLVAHYPMRQCKQCGITVGAPAHPPYNRMPRYCGDTCRTAVSAAHGHHRPWQRKTALELEQAITYMPHPLADLPHRNWCTPYNIPHDLAPALPATTAKVANSIAWWNHFLTTADPVDLLTVAHLGRLGWGGADTPRGCLPLFKCWPWITDAARRRLNTFDLLDYWRVAQAAYSYSWARVQNRKEWIRERIIVFNENQWMHTSKERYYIGQPSKFIQDLVNYLAMYDPPNLELCYTAKERKFLMGAHFDAFYTEWEAQRQSYKHYPAKWDDITPIPDRTHAMIDDILDVERSKR